MNFYYKQQGFTLIELMVVVAVIGILASIAIPQYSSFRLKAFNGAAASDLKNFTTKLSAFRSESHMYPNPTVATWPNKIILTDGSHTSNLHLSKGITVSLEAASISGAQRCMFSKHLSGDTIMYANTSNLSVIDFVRDGGDADKTLTNASTYAAAQASACTF